MLRYHFEQTGNFARVGCVSTRPLPNVSTEQLTGVIKIMAGKSCYGYWKLADLHERLKLNTDHFLLFIEAATMLDFGQAHDNAITLTLMGRAFAFSDNWTRKHIFAEHLLSRIPLVTDIHHLLVTQAKRCASKEQLLKKLERDLSSIEAKGTLDTIIDWGRYAGLFSYNDTSGLLHLADR